AASLRKFLVIVVLSPVILGIGWWYFHQRSLPDYGPSYREYAYVTNGKSNTVSVIDLTPRPIPSFNVIKSIPVGNNPTGVASNPKKPEIYVVDTASDNVSVIDAQRNAVIATIGVHGRPYFMAVSPDGKRGYVPNSGSANISVLDLEKKIVIATLKVGGSPEIAKVSEDGKIVVVANRADGTVSLVDAEQLKVRNTIQACSQPSDIAIQHDSRKAFVACSGSGQVAAIDLKNDRLLALLDVGKTPVSLLL